MTSRDGSVKNGGHHHDRHNKIKEESKYIPMDIKRRENILGNIKEHLQEDTARLIEKENEGESKGGGFTAKMEEQERKAKKKSNSKDMKGAH